MPAEIERVGEVGAVEWDDFVRRQSEWTPFHLFGWRLLLERVFGHKCDYLAARDRAGAVSAVLPLVRVRSRVFGDYMVSVPFCSYGGPLGELAAQAALVEHASELARKRNVDLLELRCRSARPFELEVSHRKLTVVLDLSAGEDAVWRSFTSQQRNKIRRPARDGVEVRFGTRELDGFYSVFAQHMHELGTPALPRRFFEVLVELYGDDVWVGVAALGGRPIACGLGLAWGDEFEITWGSSLREFNAMRPNSLLYWEFMKLAMTRGLKVFNFGRCSRGTGPHKFKMQWGSEEQELWWYGASQGPRRDTPSPDQGRFSLGPRLWRRLPGPLVNALGPHIVRYLP